MADVLTPEQRRLNMSRIRGKDTKPEVAFRKALWALGLRYKLHPALPGRPDIAFIKAQVAVFVDGCFWHGCPEHGVKPKTNAEFWDKKIKKNIERDSKVNALLEKAGWTVVRVWEHDVRRKNPDVIHSIAQLIRRRLQSPLAATA